jgi:hypothetical protein
MYVAISRLIKVGSGVDAVASMAETLGWQATGWTMGQEQGLSSADGGRRCGKQQAGWRVCRQRACTSSSRKAADEVKLWATPRSAHAAAQLHGEVALPICPSAECAPVLEAWWDRRIIMRVSGIACR